MAVTRSALVLSILGLIALGLKKASDERAESDLWAEATDPVPSAPLR